MYLRKWSAVLGLLAGVIVTALPSFSQISGDIQVNVADQTGAVIPGATVSLRNKGTGTTRTGTTDANGTARFAQLAIGSYEVRVDAPGFATFSTAADVNSGAITTVPITLEIKKAQQEIVVAETATPLNTVNAQLQNTSDSTRIVNLPVSNNAGPLALAGTAPGVIPVTPRNPFLGLGSFNSNGGRGRGNNITLDNATATDVSTTGSAGLGTVPLDAISEFNVITNNFNAEYGRNSSAQVQILTKSGTNDLHGRLFEFFRNDKLNARDYFDRTGKPTVLRDNDWGGVAGGPAVKDRLFWFGTYEQQKIRGSGGTRLANVPTPAQVAGATDPTAKQLLDRLQVPTSPSGTVTNAAPLGTNIWAFSGRADANLTSRDFFYVRFGTQDTKQQSPGLTFINSNLPTNGASVANRVYNATLSETHTFGPSTINQFLASFGRSAPVFPPLQGFGGPEINFSDGTSTFGIWSGLPQGRVQNTFQYLDALTHNRGPHQLKFGADIGRIQANSFFDASVRGQLFYVSLDDFLKGRAPIQYQQRFGNSVRGNRVWNGNYFAQDDYRVSRYLSVNLGVRLEVAGGAREVNNILSNLNLSKTNVALGGAGTGLLGAFDIGGSYFQRNWNWAPRFGFAWNPHAGRLVVRGGYGMAYDFIFLNPITNGRFMPPLMYLLPLPGASMTGNNSLASIIAGTSDFQRDGNALVGNFGTTIKNFGSFSPIDQHLRNPQVQQWNLTVEREMPWNLLARVSYVGTKGNYLQRSRVINPLRPGVLTPPTTPEEEAARITELRAINTALIAGSNRIDPRFTTLTLVDSSANSHYHGLQAFLSRRFAGGYSFSVAYTFSKSIDDVSDVLGVLATDTAAQQNPFDNRNNRAVSQFDIPHRLVVTHIFEPQFTAQISNRVLRTMLHGWRYTGIFQAQSGFPQNFTSGPRLGIGDPALVTALATTAVRPNLIGPLTVHFDANPGLGAQNPNKVTGSGLAQPLIGNFGTLGRNVIRLNPLVQADWTVAKSFKITEGLSTEFQSQFFNVFNNTTFSRPGAVLSAPATFGYYTDTDTDSRRIVFALRLIW